MERGGPYAADPCDIPRKTAAGIARNDPAGAQGDPPQGGGSGVLRAPRGRFLLAQTGHDDHHPGAYQIPLLHEFQKGFAKIEQSLIASFVLDRHLGKDQQLALFLNQAYFGEAGGKSIRGFDEAARTYFGKPLSDLSEDEFIGLVGMLIGPNELRPDTAAYKERVGRIKNLLTGKCQPTAVFDPYYEACSTAG